MHSIRFKVKYHPQDSASRQEELLAGVNNRLQSFLFLLENKWLENIMLDIDKAEEVMRVLDAGIMFYHYYKIYGEIQPILFINMKPATRLIILLINKSLFYSMIIILCVQDVQ